MVECIVRTRHRLWREERNEADVNDVKRRIKKRERKEAGKKREERERHTKVRELQEVFSVARNSRENEE